MDSPGSITAGLAERVQRVVGIDTAPKVLAEAEKAEAEAQQQVPWSWEVDSSSILIESSQKHLIFMFLELHIL